MTPEECAKKVMLWHCKRGVSMEEKAVVIIREAIAQARQDERERCAKIAEAAGIKEECCQCGTKNEWLNPVFIARAIRQLSPDASKPGQEAR